MAFTIPNAADAAFSAQAEPDSRDFDIINAAAKETGVVSGCAVTTTGATNGSVTVAVGIARIDGRKITVAGGTVAIAANSSGNARFDLITVDTSGTLAAEAGATATDPVFPAIPSSRAVLAAVYVANGHTTATNLAANTITDKRVMIADAELENVLYYGATGNARGFIVTTAANSGQGVVVSQLATPTGAGTSTSTTGGTLAAATYGYRVSAYNQYGETTASTTVTQATTGTTSTVTVSWTAVTGALGYRVYGRTSGSELLIYTVAAPATSFLDYGARTPAGALPGANTTGPFTSDMVGRAVYLSGGGAAAAQYAGTVSAFTSATQITVTPNITTTVTAGATATVGTDDSSAIDLAVAALVSGSTLYFPAGQYLASSTGVLLTNKSNITITGDYATVIGIAEDLPVIHVRNSSQIAVDRLRVQHATTSARTGTGYGIYLEWSQDAVVKDCYVFHMCAGGIVLEGVARGTVYSNTVKDTLADGIHVTGGAVDINVVGNRLINTGDDSIAFVGYRTDGNPVSRFTATTNTIYRSKARGIGIVGASQGSVVGNSINETNAAGILVAQETAFSTYGVSDVLIGSNTILSANTYNSPSVDHGAIHINCQDAAWPIAGVTVVDNHIRTPRKLGFNCDGVSNSVDDLTISNNSFIGPSTDAVEALVLGGGVETARVTGNRIAFASTTGIVNWGARVVIQNNEVYYPNQADTTSIYGIALLGGVATIMDNVVIADPGKTALTSRVHALPTSGAGGSAGTSPPAPVVAVGSTDQAGTVTFGSGTGSPGTGSYVFVGYRRAMGTPVKVVISPANRAAALLLPYIAQNWQDGFEVGLSTAAPVSQANTTYAVSWVVTPA